MARPHRDPLRPLTAIERAELTHLSQTRAAPAAWVARAMALLAVADGASYAEAARAVGRRSGDAVARLVARFNREGLAAIEPRHGGGHAREYGDAEQARIVAEARRTPDRATDGVTAWSLVALQRALRRAPDELPQVSTYTIWRALRAAGFTWQRDRGWYMPGREGDVVEGEDALPEQP
jgi:transposase